MCRRQRRIRGLSLGRANHLADTNSDSEWISYAHTDTDSNTEANSYSRADSNSCADSNATSAYSDADAQHRRTE